MKKDRTKHCPHCRGLLLLGQPGGTFKFRCPHDRCKKLIRFKNDAVITIDR